MPYIDVLPRSENGTSVEAVEVAGRSHRVRPGWNRLELGLRATNSLRVRIDGVRGPEEAGAGALAEVRVPGLGVREVDRVPSVLTDGVRGGDLAGSALSYLFARETGDDPLRDQSADPETDLRRSFDLPAARGFDVDALVSVAHDAPDPLLDAIAGTRARGTALDVLRAARGCARQARFAGVRRRSRHGLGIRRRGRAVDRLANTSPPASCAGSGCCRQGRG